MGLLTDLMMIKSCALSMAHLKIYLGALQVLRLLVLILSEEIPEDEVSLEDVPELTMDPDNSDKMRMLYLTKCVQTYAAAGKVFVS